MDTHELLIRHARDWAGQRSRPLDPEILSEALDLREHHDELSAQTWPAGSVERLMLVLWPAYGSPPQAETVRETLDTFVRFLRATGRMASASAAPADLSKEAKRAAPKMRAAYDDPDRHSQHRVLADFGRTVGIDLDGAADLDELQGRLDRLTQEWNALPVEERQRLMPDPTPKGAKGAALTRELNAGQKPAPEPAPEPATPEEIARAAEAARTSPFVRLCLQLREWLGASKQVTQAGLLRPAVAREAYQYLDLWPWERAWDDARFEQFDRADLGPEADAIRAEAALHSWHSAGDCLPLDRLWYPLEAAQLIEVRSTTARPSGDLPGTDEEWAHAALGLTLGLAMRMGRHVVEPLELVLLLGHSGETSLERIADLWLQESVPDVAGRDPALGEMLRDVRTTWLREALVVFDDTGLWQVDGDRITLTTLGEFFIQPLGQAIEDGLIPGG